MESFRIVRGFHSRCIIILTPIISHHKVIIHLIGHLMMSFHNIIRVLARVIIIMMIIMLTQPRRVRIIRVIKEWLNIQHCFRGHGRVLRYSRGFFSFDLMFCLKMALHDLEVESESFNLYTVLARLVHLRTIKLASYLRAY